MQFFSLYSSTRRRSCPFKCIPFVVACLVERAMTAHAHTFYSSRQLLSESHIFVFLLCPCVAACQKGGVRCVRFPLHCQTGVCVNRSYSGHRPLCEKGTKICLCTHQHPVCLTAMQTRLEEIPTTSHNQRLVMVMGMQIEAFAFMCMWVCACVCALAVTLIPETDRLRQRDSRKS